GGAAILTGSLVSLGTFTISTGSMNFSNTEGSVSLPSLALALGAAITGTSAVTITNLTWTGGGFSGTGALATPAGGTVSISGANLKDFQQRTFTMAGTLTWTGTGNIRTGAAATFINSGTWDAQSDVTISNVLGGATSSFSNSGTFKKTASTGTTTIGLPFTNSGTVSVQTGTLYLSGGGGPSSGAFAALTGAGLIFGAGHSLSGPLSGGTIEFNSGTSTASGTFSAAAAIFSGGTTTL